MVGCRDIDQLKLTQGDKQRSNPTEDSPELCCGQEALIDEGASQERCGRTGSVGERHQHEMEFGAKSPAVGRKHSRIDATHFGKEMQFVVVTGKIVVLVVLKDIVEFHQFCPDIGIAFYAPVLGICIAGQPVDRFMEEVIHLPSMPRIKELDMAIESDLFKKPRNNSATVPVNEVIELAAEKVARVNGDKIKERSFASRVAE
jgi:hypothetical protein